MSKDTQKLLDAFRSIIEGKIVTRKKHDLVYEGEDVTQLFLQELHHNNYYATTVEQVEVQPGERVPAFVVENSVATFGWVFWEKFTTLKLRKLFGSIERNEKGDWKIQIPPARSTIIYANEQLKLEMDIDHPFEW